MRIKYFDLSIDRLHQDLKENSCVNLGQQNIYSLDCGNCPFTYIYKELKRKKIDIIGIVQGGLSFPLPLILPDLPPDHPDANRLNTLKIAYESMLSSMHLVILSPCNICMNINSRNIMN